MSAPDPFPTDSRPDSEPPSQAPAEKGRRGHVPGSPLRPRLFRPRPGRRIPPDFDADPIQKNHSKNQLGPYEAASYNGL